MPRVPLLLLLAGAALCSGTRTAPPRAPSRGRSLQPELPDEEEPLTAAERARVSPLLPRILTGETTLDALMTAHDWLNEPMLELLGSAQDFHDTGHFAGWCAAYAADPASGDDEVGLSAAQLGALCSAAKAGGGASSSAAAGATARALEKDAALASDDASTFVEVPVAFHLLSPKAREADVLPTLARLNELLAGMHARPAGTYARGILGGERVDARVRFRFVALTRAPDGARAACDHTTADLARAREHVSAFGLDPEQVVNVFVCDINPPGTSHGGGYANPPTYPAHQRDASIWLDPDTLADASQRGVVLAHEAGHALGLRHVFNGGCSREGDEVEDTPAMSSASAWQGCPAFAAKPTIDPDDTCPGMPGKDDPYNLMGYNFDECRNSLTAGQVARVHTVMAFARPKIWGQSAARARFGVAGAGVCAAGGAVDAGAGVALDDCLAWALGVHGAGAAVSHEWQTGQCLAFGAAAAAACVQPGGLAPLQPGRTFTTYVSVPGAASRRPLSPLGSAAELHLLSADGSALLSSRTVGAGQAFQALVVDDPYLVSADNWLGVFRMEDGLAALYGRTAEPLSELPISAAGVADVLADGRTVRVATLTAPAHPGDYVVKLLCCNGYTDLAPLAHIHVTASGGGSGGWWLRRDEGAARADDGGDGATARAVTNAAALLAVLVAAVAAALRVVAGARRGWARRPAEPAASAAVPRQAGEPAPPLGRML